MGFLGDIIGPIAGLAGGWINENQADQDLQAQRDIAGDNINLQKEFAQHGIRWKVEDAKQAGIHPLVALGANTHSFSPVSISPPDRRGGLGDSLAAAGQNIARSINATKTAEEKQLTALQLESARLDVEGKALDNQVRAKQLANIGVDNPAFPGSTNFIPGQGNSPPLVSVKPKERSASQPGRLSQEAGWVPDVGYSRTDTGLTPVVPNSLSESLEDDIIGKALWRWRNQVLPNFGASRSPPLSQLPKGANKWVWSYSKQEWQPAYADGIHPPRVLQFNK